MLSKHLMRNCDEKNISKTPPAFELAYFALQVLSQICSTLFDYPAIRECEELVRMVLNYNLTMYALNFHPCAGAIH